MIITQKASTITWCHLLKMIRKNPPTPGYFQRVLDLSLLTYSLLIHVPVRYLTFSLPTIWLPIHVPYLYFSLPRFLENNMKVLKIRIYLMIFAYFKLGLINQKYYIFKSIQQMNQWWVITTNDTYGSKHIVVRSAWRFSNSSMDHHGKQLNLG